MAHELGKTNVGEQVLDLVIPYIHDVEDRSSLSLVSRKFYDIDGITRKCVTVHTLYYPNPASLSKRFPFIESLTLKDPPPAFVWSYEHHIKITSWIEQLVLEFRCLKQLHIHSLAICDEHLETLMRTRGKDLRTLKISKCEDFSSDGLRHVSKYCNQLRTLCLKYCKYTEVKGDETWLHQLALNNTVLEMFQFKNPGIYDVEEQDVILLVNNCCKSLISLKIGVCCLRKLGDAFRYAVRLEHFGGDIHDEESELVGFHFPPNMRSLSLQGVEVTRYSIVLPYLNHIRKLKLSSFNKCQCLFFKTCPNLEVLYTKDVCGDKGLLVIGEFCKKLRKLTHNGLVTHLGLIALAKGCSKLECLDVTLGDISNEALEWVGTHLKNLRKLCIWFFNKKGVTILPLDNGVRAMLMGCSKLEKLYISLRGGLTDVGLEYIRKYGANLRSLSLSLEGNSNAGLVKLSKGCPKLKKLKLWDCPFSKQFVTSCVFNIPSLRYVWFDGRDSTISTLIRPELQL